MVAVVVPAVVGVPVMIPVGSSERPVGKLPAVMLHVYGLIPPAAARVLEYGAPTFATGTESVVMWSMLIVEVYVFVIV